MVLNIIVLILGLSFTAIFFVEYIRVFRSRQMLNYIPNIWTSLGILGTFIAIVDALGNLQFDQNHNLDIMQLVKDIAPAFTTSIIGIIGAILTSVFIKIVYANEEKAEKAEYTKEAGNVSPELMLSRLHDTVANLDKSQTRQEENLKKFLNDFTYSLETLYDKIFQTNLNNVNLLTEQYIQNSASILEKADEKLSRKIETLLSSKVKALQDMVAQEKTFMSRCAEEYKVAMDRLDEEIRTLHVSLTSSISSGFNDCHSKLLSQNEEFTSSLMKKAGAYENKIYSDIIDSINKTHENMTSALNKSIISLNEILSSNEKSISELHNLYSAEIEKCISALDSGAQNSKACSEQLSRLLEAMRGQEAGWSGLIENSEKYGEKIHVIMAGIEKIIEENKQLKLELLNSRKQKEKSVRLEDVKICPNCREENSLEAHYCRKCSYSFIDEK